MLQKSTAGAFLQDFHSSPVLDGMKVKTLTYAMLRKTDQFENDRAEVTVDLGPRDTFEDAVDLAKSKCCEALNHEPYSRFDELIELLLELPPNKAKVELQSMIARLNQQVRR